MNKKSNRSEVQGSPFKVTFLSLTLLIDQSRLAGMKPRMAALARPA